MWLSIQTQHARLDKQNICSYNEIISIFGGFDMNDYDYRFETKRVVFVIDTKSFYASRGLNPMKVPLVVV